MLIIATICGLVVILVTLRDVVHELFHPQGRGSISRAVMRGVWAVAQRIGRRFPKALQLAGPAILIAVAVVWSGLLTLGWALIYWPRLPGEFRADPTLPPSATHGIVTAIYISMATLVTVGSSDITPRVNALRIVTMLEAFVGFAMMTAWITWVLSIYPVLAQRRAFARTVDLLRRVHNRPGMGITGVAPVIAAQMLGSLAEQVVTIDAQLGQAPVTYYFQERSRDATLVAQLPYLLEVAHLSNIATVDPSVRSSARMLRLAIDDLVGSVGRQFLQMDGARTEDLLDALARDHLRSGGSSQGGDDRASA